MPQDSPTAIAFGGLHFEPSSHGQIVDNELTNQSMSFALVML